MKSPASLSLLCALFLLPSLVSAQIPVTKSSFEPASGTIVDARWKSGLSLGGIGVGKIELLTDGSFGNFTLLGFNAPTLA